MNPVAQLDADTRTRAARVRALVLDVDGILTDGRLYYSNSGEEIKSFHIQDGLGIKLLQAGGVPVAIISSRHSPAVERRARELGIAHVRLGIARKLEAFEALTTELRIEPSDCAGMGDDLPDLAILQRCGFAASVPEAPDAVRASVHYVTRRTGGRGAVREVCEVLLAARGHWEATLQEFAS
ncbi:MAG TPA: HAD-IIIA family hydrolase [Burkholderiales bacterium]|nr:HAD-IIIA family hydrolase [Burkholderiales bacterium]